MMMVGWRGQVAEITSGYSYLILCTRQLTANTRLSTGGWRGGEVELHWVRAAGQGRYLLLAAGHNTLFQSVRDISVWGLLASDYQ